MTETIEELDFSRKISKNELLQVLKQEASKIHVHDLMRASAYLHEEAKHMQTDYKKNFINVFITGFINRFKEVISDGKEYDGYVEGKNLQKFLNTLNIEREIQRKDLNIKSEEYFRKFEKITEVVAIYTTFILESPVHPVGTLFPGGFTLQSKKGTYLCPVKEKNLNNPYALCRFCVSKQLKDI
jgi:Uncharacterized protein conserved in archaea